jgi:GT2 family glycosyltransferase
MKHVSLIILTFNSEKYIKAGFLDDYIKALRRLKKSCYKISFVILDNNSSDSTIFLINKKYPFVDLIYSFYNLGYCKGVNVALQYAFFKYQSNFFIISDDDAKPREDCFVRLIKFMETHPEAAFVQPLVRGWPDLDRIYSAGHEYISDGRCLATRNYDSSKSYIEIPSGSILCSVIRSKALKRIGLLDERFYMYYESSDLGFRFRRAGFKNYCLFSAVAYHERTLDRNTPIQQFFINRNRILFWYKHDKKLFGDILEQVKQEIKDFEEKHAQNNYVLIDDLDTFVKYLANKDALKLIKIFRYNKYKEPRLKDYGKFNQLVFYEKRKFL